MQRVSFERLARCLFGDAMQRSRAKKVNHDRTSNDGERCRGRLDGMGLRADEPLRSFPDHDGGEQEQERRFGQRGNALDLAVPVLMLPVGGFSGKPDREIGQHRCGQVDKRMTGLREDSERTRQQADGSLGRG